MSYSFTDPAIRLPEENLNDRERRVLAYMRRAVQPVSIQEIADHVFVSETSRVKAYTWAKNQLRRLFVARYVKQLAHGIYQAVK